MALPPEWDSLLSELAALLPEWAAPHLELAVLPPTRSCHREDLPQTIPCQKGSPP